MESVLFLTDLALSKVRFVQFRGMDDNFRVMRLSCICEDVCISFRFGGDTVLFMSSLEIGR